MAAAGCGIRRQLRDLDENDVVAEPDLALGHLLSDLTELEQRLGVALREAGSF
jgi:hypothetical protein